MLNELLALEQGLSAYGFAPAARHPDLSQLLKGDVVRVRLAADGAIAEVELLDGETRPDVWTLRDGKHNGFPGLKTGQALLVWDQPSRAEHDARWKAAKSPAAKRNEIARVAAATALDPNAADWLKPGHRARIRERLADLLPLRADPEARAVPAAFERFLAAAEAQPPLPHRLCDALLDRARNGEDGWLDIVRSALVGAVPLAIDVTRDFARDAGDARQTDAVSRVLFGGARSGGAVTGREPVCALSGSVAPLLAGNFPQPTLPSLGQTYLFSRNDDIRALARYGRNGPSSLPIEANLVGRFAGALAEITAKDRLGKTWRLLPAAAGDGQDLFIAFVALAADFAAAKSLSDGEDDDEDDDDGSPLGPAHVEQATSRMASLWQAVAGRSRPGETARILILRTVDPGNRKAAYDRSPSVNMLHQAALDWTAAMRNAPDWIGWTVFKDKRAIQGRPKIQAPLALIALSRKLYVRGGRDAVDAPGVAGADAMALFLAEGDRPRRARRVLRLLLERHTVLLVGVTQAKLRGRLKDFDPKAVTRADALRSAAWMAALLSFLGRTKEVYMADAGFKLGQLLSAADAVHMGYCAEVRGGDVPPTLVGNSVFAAAGRNPDRALEVLQTRWKPYHAWVTKAAKKTEVTRAEADRQGKPKPQKDWSVARAISQAWHARRLCEELHPVLTRMRQESRAPDETFRAELLLGYVAGIKFEKHDDKAEPEEKGAAA